MHLDFDVALQIKKLKVKLDQEEYDFQKASSSRFYIIRVDNQYNFYWRLLIIILAIYNAIALPMQIAFAEV